MKKTILLIILFSLLEVSLNAQNLKTFDGKTIPLYEVIDDSKPTTVIFFAIWNDPSTRLLNNLAQEYTEISKTAKIVALTYVTKNDNLERIEQTCKNMNWPFETYMFENDSLFQVLYDKYCKHLGVPTSAAPDRLSLSYRCYKRNNTNQFYVNLANLQITSNTINSSPYNSNNYESVNEAYDKLYIVSKYGKFGIVNHNGNILSAVQYDRIIASNGIFKVKKNSQWGILNKDGKILISTQYEDIKAVDSTRFISMKNNKYGLINEMNQTILPFEYLEINRLTEFYYEAKNSSGKWGIVVPINIGKLIPILKFTADEIIYDPSIAKTSSHIE